MTLFIELPFVEDAAKVHPIPVSPKTNPIEKNFEDDSLIVTDIK